MADWKEAQPFCQTAAAVLIITEYNQIFQHWWIANLKLEKKQNETRIFVSNGEGFNYLALFFYSCFSYLNIDQPVQRGAD